jgi:hypothetical protein
VPATLGVGLLDGWGSGINPEKKKLLMQPRITGK